MAIKKLYILQSQKDILESLPPEVSDYLWSIDEDYDTKREWMKMAKYYTNIVNSQLDESDKRTLEELFGECVYRGWCYCTECDEHFWADDGHECE